jgi:hypothetical protein
MDWFHLQSPDFVTSNPMLVMEMINFVLYLSLSFENIYEFREDFERQIFCVVTLGIGIQGIKKTHTFIFNRREILKLLKLAEDFHKRSKDSKDSKSANVFEKWMMTMAHIGSFLAVTFSIVAFLVLIYPAVFYLIVNEKILHFGFIIPGIDWTSPTGYTINFIYHTYQIYLTTVGLYVTCIFTIFFIINAFAQFESLELEIDNLGDLATKNKNNCNDKQIKSAIKDITDQHVKLLE